MEVRAENEDATTPQNARIHFAQMHVQQIQDEVLLVSSAHAVVDPSTLKREREKILAVVIHLQYAYLAPTAVVGSEGLQSIALSTIESRQGIELAVVVGLFPYVIVAHLRSHFLRVSRDRQHDWQIDNHSRLRKGGLQPAPDNHEREETHDCHEDDAHNRETVHGIDDDMESTV